MLGHVCRRYHPLGNVIVIERAGGPAYVDVGFGVERLCAASRGGDLYAVSPFRARIGRLTALGCDRQSARAIVNVATTVCEVVRAGCEPGPRGAGHVLRTMIRRLHWLVADRASEGVDLRAAILACDADSRCQDVIEAEIAAYLVLLPVLRRQAASLARKHADQPPDVV